MAGRKPKARPSAEELALWQKVARSVTPLKQRAPAPEARQPAPAGRPRIIAKASQVPLVAPQQAPAPTPAKPKEPLETGRLAGIDRRTGDRFRRGRMEIEATLDLHGMTQERAHAVLRRFLREASARGQRCLLVVTGKGRAGPGSGVLRRAVPLWLNDPDLRPLVLAVTPAQQHHGGEGALYVLLRRRRERDG